MDEPSLQGFREIDELCFSPVWRKDYRRLDRYRIGTYFHYYFARLLSHPLKLLRMFLRILDGRCMTKSEMTARRIFRDIPDRLKAMGRPGICE